MRRIFVLVVVAMMGSSVCGMAEGFAVGGKVGTLGLGAEITLGLGEDTNIRLGVNGASITLHDVASKDSNADVKEIEYSLDLQSFAALFDWHTWGGGFRLTGGAMLNNNEVSMSADLNKRLSIGNQSYTVSSFDGVVSFSDVVPYFGIGYGDAVDEAGRLTFAFDLGVMLQGSPDVEVKATASNPALQDALNSDLLVEAQEIEDDVEAMKVYPVISIGLAYSF